MVTQFKKDFPDSSETKAQLARAFNNEDELDDALLSLRTGTPLSDKAEVVSTSVENRIGMTFGDSVALTAVLCDNEKAQSALRDKVEQIVLQNSFDLLRPWDEVGFIAFHGKGCNHIFQSPSQCEDADLLLKVDQRLGDKKGVVTFMYDVKAGLRGRDPTSFSDASQTTVVRTYMATLAEQVRKAANDVLQASCTKLQSGPKSSKEEALNQVKGRLNRMQQQQLVTAIGKQ